MLFRSTNDEEDTTIKGQPPTLGGALAPVVQEKLRFAPGTKTNYTSWGYAVLGCVIESVTGQRYAAALKDLVLDPAGLADTAFDEPAFASARFSPGFRLVGGTLAPSEVVDTRFKTPASGVISTVNDLVKLALALMDHTLLPASLTGQMQTVPPLPAGETPVFTAGWTIGPSGLGTPAFNYNGSMEGSTALLVIVPERRVAVALLANRERFVREVLPIAQGAVRAALESH